MRKSGIDYDGVCSSIYGDDKNGYYEMTVVVGFSWLSEVVMIADTRISWLDGSRPPEDILRKLYIFGNTQKAVVLGFSGDVAAAKEILTFLRERKLKNMRRKFVIARFKEDLRDWIEEAVNTCPNAGSPVTFMLCGIEPSRHPPVFRRGQQVRILPFPESHIYVYTRGEKTGRMNVTSPTGFAIIGGGATLEKEVQKKVNEGIRFGFSNPQLHWARAFIIGDIVASLFKERQSPTIGGPFQVIRITPLGIEEQYVWPPNVESKGVVVQGDGMRTIVVNPALGETFTLYPIWEI